MNSFKIFFIIWAHISNPNKSCLNLLSNNQMRLNWSGPNDNSTTTATIYTTTTTGFATSECAAYAMCSAVNAARPTWTRTVSCQTLVWTIPVYSGALAFRQEPPTTDRTFLAYAATAGQENIVSYLSSEFWAESFYLCLIYLLN